MLYSFPVLGLVEGAGILSELSVQFQETHRCASRRSIKTGFPGPEGAPVRIGRRSGLSRAGPHAPTQITVICTTAPPSTPPRTVGTKITTWVILTPSSSKARLRSSRASPARSALTSSKSRGPPAARATPSVPSVSPPQGIPVAQQRLIFKQQELIDRKRLYDSEVFDGATVHLVLRLARLN